MRGEKGERFKVSTIKLGINPTSVGKTYRQKEDEPQITESTPHAWGKGFSAKSYQLKRELTPHAWGKELVE